MTLALDSDALYRMIRWMFKKAWPVWRTHQGCVPAHALRQLEVDLDAPRGVSKVIMRRISREPDLRNWLEHECDEI